MSFGALPKEFRREVLAEVVQDAVSAAMMSISVFWRRQTRNKTLARMRLVSSAWNDLAKPMFFARPFLKSDESIKKFFSLLKADASLVALVQNVMISPEKTAALLAEVSVFGPAFKVSLERLTFSTQLPPVTLRHFMKLALDHLAVLVQSSGRFPRFAAPTTAWTATLTSLDLSGDGALARVFEDGFLRRLPALKHLDITLTEKYGEYDVEDELLSSLKVMGSQLETFRYAVVDEEIDCEFCDGPVDPALLARLPNVQTLSLPNDVPITSSGATMPHLRTLVVGAPSQWLADDDELDDDDKGGCRRSSVHSCRLAKDGLITALLEPSDDKQDSTAWFRTKTPQLRALGLSSLDYRQPEQYSNRLREVAAALKAKGINLVDRFGRRYPRNDL